MMGEKMPRNGGQSGESFWKHLKKAIEIHTAHIFNKRQEKMWKAKCHIEVA